MTATQKDMAQTANARSNVYGLLATLLREEVNSELLQELKAPQLAEVFSDLGIKLGGDFYTKPDEALIEDLVQEYTELFIGPRDHISAHASCFVELDGGEKGMLWGKETVRVKAFIEETGLEYDEAYNGIPDHISVELEFMQKLTQWEAEKWAEANSESAHHCLEIEKLFMDNHLMVWVPKLCETIRSADGSAFYARVADLLEEFLRFDHSEITAHSP